MADRIGSGSCTSLVNIAETHGTCQSPYRKRHSSSNLLTPSSATNHHQRRNQQRYKLLLEGSVQMCRVPHAKNIIEKIRFSRFLRHWEEHQISLEQNEIVSKTVREEDLSFRTI